MKKINEATRVNSATVSGWKGAWENAKSLEEKEKVFRDILGVDLNYTNIYQKLLSFGMPFVESWLKAMKFEELANYKNDLIYLFDKSESQIDNFYYLKNMDNFVKLYNVYANGLLKKEYFEDNTTKDVFNELVNNPRMYQFNDSDFKLIFGTFDNLVDAWEDNQNIKGDLKFVFLENDNGKVTGDINQIPTINEHINIINDKNSNINSNINQGSLYKRERSDIESIINNLDKWSNKDVEYLQNAINDRLVA